MMGAIIGDIVGSVYEWKNIKTKEFPLFQKGCFFTDDTVMTIAVADAIMQIEDNKHSNNALSTVDNEKIAKEILVKNMKNWGSRYPNAGYGGHFKKWLSVVNSRPYNSWGNGSAMRVSPCAWVIPQPSISHDSINKVVDLARISAETTHNHPEGIKGAVETARAILYMRCAKGDEYDSINYWKQMIISHSSYDLAFTLDEIRPTYKFDVSCQGSVPQAITAFLESTDFEDAIRNAISLGGDSDTLAAITGSIAEAAYGIPQWMIDSAWTYLDEPIRDVCRKWDVFTREMTIQ